MDKASKAQAAARNQKFGIALKMHRTNIGYTQREFAELINRSQSHFAKWEAGLLSPQPLEVFEIEEALDSGPGSLSVHLGYMPVGTSMTTEAAIASDRDLDAGTREMVLSLVANLKGDRKAAPAKKRTSRKPPRKTEAHKTAKPSAKKAPSKKRPAKKGAPKRG